MSFLNLIDFENDYEICTKYPYDIRKKANGKIISECIGAGGYVVVNLNAKTYYKHILVARQFIKNENNYPCVDHLDHDRTNYHISNLRWCTAKDNCKNKSSANGVVYDFVYELPEDSVIIFSYNNHILDEPIYFSIETMQFYKKITDSYFRIMHQRDRSKNSTFVNMASNDNKRVNIYTNNIVKNLDMYDPVFTYVPSLYQ